LLPRRGRETGPIAAVPPPATLYARVLFLRRTRLRWWVRSIYLEGAVVVGFVLYLANVASAWVIVVLPAAIAVMVKVYDLVVSATARLPPH
jgi:hypothetical protein